MSISAIREFLEKPGCTIAVSAVLLVVLILGLLNGGSCSQFGSGAQPQAVRADVVAKLGDTQITLQEVQMVKDETMKQFGGLQDLPPIMEANLDAQAFSQVLEKAYIAEVAKQKNVRPSEADLKNVFDQSYQGFVAQLRSELASKGQLKPTASEQEFAEAVKKATGQDLSAIKQKAQEDFDKRMNDPALRAQLEADAIQPILLNYLITGIKPSEKDLKDSFTTFNFKKLSFLKGEDAKAEAALKEIKGGASFDQVFTKYNKAPKGSELAPIPYVTLQNIDVYQPLMKLEPKQVSDLVHEPRGITIYELLDKKTALPKDFDQAKSKYLQQYQAQAARVMLASDIQKVRETAKIDWKSEGYRLVYEFMTGSPTGQHAQEELDKMITAAKEALNSDSLGAKQAALVYYMALMEKTPKGAAPSKELMEQRAEATEALNAQSPRLDYELDLVNIFLQIGNSEKANAHLLAAAQMNNDPSAMGQKNFEAIASSMAQLEKMNALNADTKKLVITELERWKSDKKREDDYQAQQKAEEKKMMDDAKAEQKRLDEAKKAGVKVREKGQ